MVRVHQGARHRIEINKVRTRVIISQDETTEAVSRFPIVNKTAHLPLLKHNISRCDDLFRNGSPTFSLHCYVVRISTVHPKFILLVVVALQMRSKYLITYFLHVVIVALIVRVRRTRRSGSRRPSVFAARICIRT